MQSTRSVRSISENIFAEEIPIMTAKYFRWSAALLGLTVAIFLQAEISRAQYGSAPAPAPAATPAQNAPAPKESGKQPKVNKAEEAAYKGVLAAQGGDPAMQIQVGEEFITKFPMSRYVGGVYGMLTTAYYTTGNTDKMFAAGAKALELDPDNVDVLALLAMARKPKCMRTTPSN
jgi:hypothetical protein